MKIYRFLQFLELSKVNFRNSLISLRVSPEISEIRKIQLIYRFFLAANIANIANLDISLKSSSFDLSFLVPRRLRD